MSDAYFGVDFSMPEFEIGRSDAGYEIRDRDGTVLLRARRESPQAEYTFEDSHGEPVFTVTNGCSLDVSGEYAVVDDQTETPVVTLTKHSNLLYENWKVADAATEEQLVDVSSVGKILSFLEWFSSSLQNHYIADLDGNLVGGVEYRSSPDSFATANVEITDDARRHSVVAATLAIVLLGDD